MAGSGGLSETNVPSNAYRPLVDVVSDKAKDVKHATNPHRFLSSQQITDTNMKYCSATFLSLMGIGIAAVIGDRISEKCCDSKQGYWMGALIAIVLLAAYYRFCLRNSNRDADVLPTRQPPAPR